MSLERPSTHGPRPRAGVPLRGQGPFLADSGQAVLAMRGLTPSRPLTILQRQPAALQQPWRLPTQCGLLASSGLMS